MGWLAPERLPYCGAAPTPASLWLRWNLDPVLLAVLFIVAVGYAVGARRGGFSWRTIGFATAGWSILALALASPLCPLSVSLFSARVGQHMILTLVAAPLIALGRPVTALSALWNGRVRQSGGAPLAAAGVFAAALWFWHAPAPYGLTFISTPIYWAMHLSMIGAAIWLWGEVLAADGATVRVVAAALIATMAMGLLGALITFSPRPLYAAHLLTAPVWGFTPLEDQQLGGAIMWVPGGLTFLGAAIAATWRAISSRAPALAWTRS